jgi:homoserine kinase
MDNRDSVELVLPATSANLGPAFDAAALAFNLCLRVKARAGKEFSIQAKGRNADICGRLEEHLILATYRDVLESEGTPVQRLSLHIDNEIPIGKGCGSSAAARLAGIALAVHFGKLRWTENQIVGEASRREHHADNAAACWLGGLTVARMVGDGEAQTVRIMPKGKWPLLLAVPEESLSTEEARRVLPATYSRADVVSNIQNSMFLLAALIQGQPQLMATALEDRIHQPYRSSRCPLLPTLEKLDRSSGTLGVALSGAGPSVLIFVDPKASITGVKTRVKNHLRAAGLSAELISATITESGGSSYFPSLRKKKKTGS